MSGRRFDYVVAQNMLDLGTVSYLLEHVFTLLVDGGRALFIETNPWNPMSVVLAVSSADRSAIARRPTFAEPHPAL